MEKKVLALLLISVFLFSVIISLAVVKAQEEPAAAPANTANVKTYSSGLASGGISNWFYERWQLWKRGVDWKNPQKDFDMLGETVKYFALLLIIILVYSALSSAQFPSNGALRLILAIAVGFLATFLITTNELITALESYKAMGVALIIFFPIMILAFFTLIVAGKANPIGIYIQKILWLIYSVFLFFKSGVLYILTYYVKVDSQGNLLYLQQVVQEGAEWVVKEAPNGVTAEAGGALPDWLGFFLPAKDPSQLAQILTRNDGLTLGVLLVVAIGVFIIMVLGNHYVVAWFEKERRDAAIEAQKSRIEKSAAYDKLRSEAMDKG